MCDETLEQEIIERWSATYLLQGLRDKKASALVLEVQRLYNETTPDSDKIAQFKRVSIPIMRRVLGYMQDMMIPIKGTTLNVDESFICSVPLDIGSCQDDQGRHNLDLEARYIAYISIVIAKELAEVATKNGIVLGHLEYSPDDFTIKVNYERR